MGHRQTAEVFELDTLNAPQREAVLHSDGPLLVLAGAGSGKTRVIIYRIARLMRDGVPPDKILGVTFTNKAAKEMRLRLSALAGRKASKVTLSTFHSLGLTILKDEHAAAGLKAGFCIYDTSDQLSLVRDLMRQVKVADRRLDASRLLDLMLKAKRERRDEIEIDWGDDYELAAFDLYPRYLQQMRAFNAIDFDDLLLRSQDVLQIPEVRERWTQRFHYLLVDEYQDTSPDQLELVRVLAGPRQNVCAVGDDDQAIYAWRGAAVDNILSFSRQFTPTHEVVLDQNYRSTSNILAAANAVIRNNQVRKPKQLWSASGSGDPVEVVECSGDDDEANFVVETIAGLHYRGVPYGDIAVLYRSNAQSRLFEETLALEHIPFRVVGGQAFFDRKEVRDGMAFLSIAHNPLDEVALRRVINVPPRGIGPASLERLADYGERTGKGLWGALLEAEAVPDLPKTAALGAATLVEVLEPARERLKAAMPGQAAGIVRELFDTLALRDAIVSADDAPSISAKRLENLEQAVTSLQRFEERLAPGDAPLAEFLRASALVRSPAEDDEDKAGQVTLMTLHSAKGLEFPYVVLVGVEEELLPHKRSLELGGSLDEERRLCYVGITRARKRLWITWCRRRMMRGKPAPRSPSRFLEELPNDEGVRCWAREEPPLEENQEDMAADFFKKMRAQLGIEDDA
ncbi:MAG TPA: UvrD-helicase domain-containing protein [Myxococcota bacterium]|nr:UvrD-helicase domain-containing protein [Myxococcota bacterium]